MVLYADDRLIDGPYTPNISGYSSVVTNLGKVVNSGFEISLHSVNIDNEKFQLEHCF